jgi:integrase
MPSQPSGSSPPGIYRTKTGWRVVACVGRGARFRQEKRFPPGTAERTMLVWKKDTEAQLRKQPKDAPGSLLADLSAYLPAVAGMPTYAERERHLRLWATALGETRDRATVTGADIRAVLERWRTTPRPPRSKTGKGQPWYWSTTTLNHLRTALMHFYTVLNGKSGANPVRDVPKYRGARRPPPRIDYATLELILAAMPDVGQGVRGQTRRAISQTKARLRVIAYTGLPHRQIGLLKPEHLVAEARLLYVAGRQKGEGTDDTWLPLSHAGLAAVTALFACGAGTGEGFSTSSMWKSFKRAARAIGRTDLTPYHLKHLFGTTVLRATKNRAATRDLLMHTSDVTTARYARAAIPAELWAALALFDREVVAAGLGSDQQEDTETARTH